MIRVIDFESTGFLRAEASLIQPGITQVGILELDDQLNEIRFLESYINPNVPLDQWSPQAIEVTRITPQMVTNAPTLDKFFDILSGAILGTRYWVGYNNQFDRMLLWHNLVRYKLMRCFPWPAIDVDVMDAVTMRLGQRPDKNSSRWNLALAYKTIFGFPFEGAHGALADCRATAAILRAIVPVSRFAATPIVQCPQWAGPIVAAPIVATPVALAAQSWANQPWPTARIVD
jgi:DNA polymerase III epsilon subunit-like protein